jgi:uncharacterized protein (TIGR02231 family)
MKLWFGMVMVGLTLGSNLSAAEAPPAEGDGEKAVVSKIGEVTLYADRARVVRSAAVELAAGVGKLAFHKLPGWIDEGSVRVSLAPAEAGELLEVEVQKTYLARPDDEEIRKAEAAVQELADQKAALEDERAAIEAQTRQLDSIRAFSLDKMPKDAVVREIKIDEYAAMLKFVGDSMTALAKAKRELAKKQRELDPELNARQRKLNELRQRAQLEQRSVIVTIKSAGAGRQAKLKLTYMLPGATWEPVHELRRDGAADKVTLASFGIVTQTTGEDWDGVTLWLSTQHSTDTIRIPELEKLLVGSGPAGGADDTFSIASRKFSGQIKIWNVNQNPIGIRPEFEKNVDFQQAAQGRNIAKFKRIQERRGTTVHFAAAGLQTVRTDGRPVRVPIGSEQLAAQPKIVAAPAVSLNAARTVELLNSGKQPFLPGDVLLYIDGAFLGTTEMDFVAPGENFPVFVGVADQIKLTRELDQKRSSLTWSGKRTRMQVSFVLSAENLGDKPVAVQVADRIPVSETDEIRVLGVEIQPEVKPDVKGILHWEVTLAAGEKKKFRIDYTLDYPKELPKAMKVEGKAPAAPIYKQIDDLERMF